MYSIRHMVVAGGRLQNGEHDYCRRHRRPRRIRNGLTTVHAYGAFGSGTLSLEVTPDGVTWVPVATSNPATLVAPGSMTWRGVSKGIRAKLTGATAANLNAVAVFQDQN